MSLTHGMPNQKDIMPFAMIVLAILLAPWPLGSNRDWAWPVLTILISLATIGMVFQRSPALTLPIRVTLLAFAALVTLMALQLWGVPGVIPSQTADAFATRSELLKTITLMGFFFTLTQTLNSRYRINIIIYAVLFSAAAQSLLGATQQLFFSVDRATGSFPNANHFAGYLAMSICLGIGFFLSKSAEPTHSGQRSMVELITGELARLRIIIVILVIALVMSRSRMGNVAFLAGTIAAMGIGFFFFRQFNKPAIILLASILLIDGIVLGSYFGIERLGERIRNTTEHAAMRIDLQGYNFEIVKDHLWFGTGAGSYETAFSPYRDDKVLKKANHAETDYMEFLVELGLIGIAPLLLIVGSAMVVQLTLMRTRSAQQSWQRHISFGCLAGTFSVLVHAIADVNLQIPSNSLLFVLLLTLPHAMLNQSIDNQGALPS